MDHGVRAKGHAVARDRADIVGAGEGIDRHQESGMGDPIKNLFQGRRIRNDPDSGHPLLHLQSDQFLQFVLGCDERIDGFLSRLEQGTEPLQPLLRQQQGFHGQFTLQQTLGYLCALRDEDSLSAMIRFLPKRQIRLQAG